MYVYIYYWKSINNRKQWQYCPETITGTVFSIKKDAPTGNNSCQCVSVPCDYHKVGMSVKGRLVGTQRTHFHSHILRSEIKGPGPVFPHQNVAQVLSIIQPPWRQASMTWFVPMDSLGSLVSYDIFTLSLKLTQQPKNRMLNMADSVKRTRSLCRYEGLILS